LYASHTPSFVQLRRLPQYESASHSAQTQSSLMSQTPSPLHVAGAHAAVPSQSAQAQPSVASHTPSAAPSQPSPLPPPPTPIAPPTPPSALDPPEPLGPAPPAPAEVVVEVVALDVVVAPVVVELVVVVVVLEVVVVVLEVVVDVVSPLVEDVSSSFELDASPMTSPAPLAHPTAGTTKESAKRRPVRRKVGRTGRGYTSPAAVEHADRRPSWRSRLRGHPPGHLDALPGDPPRPGARGARRPRRPHQRAADARAHRAAPRRAHDGELRERRRTSSGPACRARSPTSVTPLLVDYARTFGAESSAFERRAGDGYA
jgi:hypothetical protein